MGPSVGEKEAGAMTVQMERRPGEAATKVGGSTGKAVSSHAPQEAPKIFRF